MEGAFVERCIKSFRGHGRFRESCLSSRLFIAFRIPRDRKWSAWLTKRFEEEP